MSEPGTRPGGLTALAVINFVFAALGMLGAGSIFLGSTLLSVGLQHAEADAAQKAALDRQAETRGAATRSAEAVAKETKDLEEMRKAKRAFDEHGTLIMLAGVVTLVLGILLLVSGIGYLKLRRGLGRTVGTVYALGAIGWGICEVVFAERFGEGRSFGLWNLVGFIYPLVTLFALHRIFKDDFVNP